MHNIGNSCLHILHQYLKRKSSQNLISITVTRRRISLPGRMLVTGCQTVSQDSAVWKGKKWDAGIKVLLGYIPN